jgi:xylulokinase
MSLIGIDLGTSAIKVGAYAEDGTLLAAARRPVPGHRPGAGHWEVDVHDSRAAFWSTLESVTRDPAVAADPPTAISFSSSGREVFPVSSDGEPLGPCLMTADTRGDDVAARTAARRSPEEWFRLAGHVPRRMDPVNRALWWQSIRPDVVARTRWFMNWHEYFSLLLSGQPVADWSDAGSWAVYDVATGRWSPERIAETGIEPRWLPEIRPNGMPIGPILPDVAHRLGVPREVRIVSGAHDTIAAAVGSAAIDEGLIALACGTWHSFTTPVRADWPVELVHHGFDVFPHPGPTGFGILSADPNGMSVIDWARATLHLTIEELEAGLAAGGSGPGPVSSDAEFTPLPHVAATPAMGAVLAGVTLATTGVDIVRALLEAITCRFSLRLDILRRHGLEPALIRATGGGSNSSWWMQLHADVSGVPVEAVAQDEPGTFGAAILGGLGTGAYASLSGAVARLVRIARRFEPDPRRGACYEPIRARLADARFAVSR